MQINPNIIKGKIVAVTTATYETVQSDSIVNADLVALGMGYMH